MHIPRNFVIFAAAILVVLGLALGLRAQVTQRVMPDNNVILQPSYLLSGAHDADLVVLGSSVGLSAGSDVSGNAALVGEFLTISGTIDGSLTAIGDTITLEPMAHVRGDVNLMGDSLIVAGRIDGNLVVNGGSLILHPSAQIAGTISTCVGAVDNPLNLAIGCTSPSSEPFAWLIALRNSALPEALLTVGTPSLGALALAAFGALGLVGTSVLAVTFFPRQISHIEEALRTRPRSFAGVGIASYALAVGLFFALTFLLALFPPLGLLLVPIFLLFGLALLLLALSGLITLSVILGDWLLRRSSRVPQPPLVAALAGSCALSLAFGALSLLPFGLVISAALLCLVSSAGLGASMYTRVGTRPAGRTYFVQG